jgi:hypothetical protein
MPLTPFYADSLVELYDGHPALVLQQLPQADHILTCPPPVQARHTDQAAALYPRDIIVQTLGHARSWAIYMCRLTQLGQYSMASDGGWVDAGVWRGVRDGALGGVAILHGDSIPRWPALVAKHWDVTTADVACADLAAQLLHALTKPGQTVLDPYCTSGDILLAAKRLGRRAIGINPSVSWCGTMARELAQGNLPLHFSRSSAQQATLL